MIMYEINISYYNTGIKETKKFRKDVSTFDELKQSFLKHFGNINDAPNKVLKEKEIVKELTYKAANLNEWVEWINNQTRWEIQVRKI